MNIQNTEQKNQSTFSELNTLGKEAYGADFSMITYTITNCMEGLRTNPTLDKLAFAIMFINDTIKEANAGDTLPAKEKTWVLKRMDNLLEIKIGLEKMIKKYI